MKPNNSKRFQKPNTSPFMQWLNHAAACLQQGPPWQVQQFQLMQMPMKSINNLTPGKFQNYQVEFFDTEAGYGWAKGPNADGEQVSHMIHSARFEQPQLLLTPADHENLRATFMLLGSRAERMPEKTRGDGKVVREHILPEILNGMMLVGISEERRRHPGKYMLSRWLIQADQQWALRTFSEYQHRASELFVPYSLCLVEDSRTAIFYTTILTAILSAHDALAPHVKKHSGDLVIVNECTNVAYEDSNALVMELNERPPMGLPPYLPMDILNPPIGELPNAVSGLSGQ